ncbi:hypothetical protein O4H49_03480 [Kiloniella laminariae]|uniref:Uncharacterized protein n=1 Tax=Kiloniella laminariae TaxID=454162 RepID=A0ABT4LFE3_9PROT|nr:hypothetical protein [Kiloniella laminariae]MCZ4279824.1 hypothetical protein [Kiloniella laminariae]
MVVLGFIGFLATYILFFNGLSQALFQIPLSDLLVSWWGYGELRALCLGMNFLLLVAALIFGLVAHNLAALLCGTKEVFIYLGLALDKGIYLARSSRPQEENYLPGDFAFFGAAGIDSLYRQIMITRYRGRFYSPLEFQPARAVILLVSCLICAFFASVTNLFVLKIYAFENGLFPGFITSNNTNIEGIASLLVQQQSFAFYPWSAGLLLLFVSLVFLFRLFRPAKMALDIGDSPRALTIPARIRPGYEMQGQVLARRFHYHRNRKNQRAKLSFITYLVKLGAPFKPAVYMTWICEDPKSKSRELADRSLENQTALALRIRDFDPKVIPGSYDEAPYCLEVVT